MIKSLMILSTGVMIESRRAMIKCRGAAIQSKGAVIQSGENSAGIQRRCKIQPMAATYSIKIIIITQQGDDTAFRDKETV